MAKRDRIIAKKSGAKNIYSKLPLFTLNEPLFFESNGVYRFAFDILYPKSFPRGYKTAIPAEKRINRKPNSFCIVTPYNFDIILS